MQPDNIASQKVAERAGMKLERQVDGIASDNFPTLLYVIENESIELHWKCLNEIFPLHRVG